MVESEVEYWPNGNKKSEIWNLGRKYHREDGPAVIFENGTKKWYRNGRLHREDGPAIEYAHGEVVYYLNGRQFTKEQYEKEISSRK